MERSKIKQFLTNHEPNKARTIVIVDFGNVEKWKMSLGWQIDIGQLANLIKTLSSGKKFLRRFYYGADYGPHDGASELIEWSRMILEKAEAYGMKVVKKRVKYIHTDQGIADSKFVKKCDLDVEMTIDLIKERDNYDTIILFSGDGDLAYALKYLHENYDKQCIVFGARDHIGREMIDAKNNGIISDILFAENFDYRLSKTRR